MLPKDPQILVSLLNMKLRDKYEDLMELCDDYDVDEAELLKLMESGGFKYDPENKCFK